MKKFAFALALVFGAALVTVRAQDKDEKKLYHMTIWANGVGDSIELEDVTVWVNDGKGLIVQSNDGTKAWIASDKLIGYVCEPNGVHKKNQEEKAPK